MSIVSFSDMFGQISLNENYRLAVYFIFANLNHTLQKKNNIQRKKSINIQTETRFTREYFFVGEGSL